MEENIKNFFEGPGREATEHLGSGANILLTIGKTSYTLKITEEREVKVEKDQKEGGDIEIRGEGKIINDLLSSSSMHEFSDKMKSYIVDGKEPQVKILMERTGENSKKFLQGYYFFLRKIGLLR